MDGVQVALGETALAGFLLALARTAGFVLIAPPFNTRSVPMQARAGVALALALPLSTWTQAVAPALGSSRLLLTLLLQLVTGVTLGAFVLLAVAAIQMVGDIVDVIGGFSMTLGMDPLQLVQTSVMGRLHQLVAVALLFAGEGHLMVLQGLARSTQLMPTPSLSWEDVASTLVTDLGGMFVAAIQIAAPIIAALLIADVALGLLTRAAPALNAFALAFPLKILLSLLLVGLLLIQVPGALRRMIEEAVVTMLRLSGG